MPRAQRGIDGLVRAHAVLDRHHHGLRADQRDHLHRRLRQAIELDAHDDHIDDAHLRRIVGGPQARCLELRAVLEHAQAAHPNGLQMAAAAYQRHLIASVGQQGPEVRADATRPHDCDLHAFNP